MTYDVENPTNEIHNERDRWKQRAEAAEAEADHFNKLAHVDLGANPPKSWKQRASELEAEVARLRGALELSKNSERASERLHRQWHDRALKAEKWLR